MTAAPRQPVCDDVNALFTGPAGLDAELAVQLGDLAVDLAVVLLNVTHAGDRVLAKADRDYALVSRGDLIDVSRPLR